MQIRSNWLPERGGGPSLHGREPGQAPFLENGSFFMKICEIAVLATFAAVVVYFKNTYLQKINYLPPPTRRRGALIRWLVVAVSGNPE